MSAEDNLSVYDIKLEIAHRIEHIKFINAPTGDFADYCNQGVIKGLDSLWKWIQASTDDSPGLEDRLAMAEAEISELTQQLKEKK